MSQQRLDSKAAYFAACADVVTDFKGVDNERALEEARKIAVWLEELGRRLLSARTIATSYDRLVEIYRELMHARFTMLGTHAAEAWILRGDWSFKTPKILIVPDFFPVAAQLQACNEPSMLVSQHRQILRDVISRSQQEWIEEGRRLERSTQKMPLTQEEIEAWKQERRGHHREIMAELERKEHYIQRIDALEAENARLKQRLAFETQQPHIDGPY